MSFFGRLPEVSDDELLARFITVERWIRDDRTVRQDAFIPPKDHNLSVTRHRRLSQKQLWKIGQAVAGAVSQTRAAQLTGRADLAVAMVAKVAAVTKTKLRTEAAPIAANRNHAHVTGWPLDKPTQKIIAQELAAAASFVPKPDDSQWDCLCKPSQIWIRIMRWLGPAW
jgi:hypothetical protein